MLKFIWTVHENGMYLYVQVIYVLFSMDYVLVIIVQNQHHSKVWPLKKSVNTLLKEVKGKNYKM